MHLQYNFQTFWNSHLEWKTKQLNGPGNYRELRETGPWPGCHVSWFLWRLTNEPRSWQTDTSPADQASLAHVIRPLNSRFVWLCHLTLLRVPSGPGKRGHIVAHVSWAAETGKHLLPGHKMFLNKIRKIFCVPNTKFVSATNVARADKRGNICVGNNMSSFARAYSVTDVFAQK